MHVLMDGCGTRSQASIYGTGLFEQEERHAYAISNNLPPGGGGQLPHTTDRRNDVSGRESIPSVLSLSVLHWPSSQSTRVQYDVTTQASW